MSKEPKKPQTGDKKVFFEKENSDSVKQNAEPVKNTESRKKKNDFLEGLEESVKGLWYMSETDAEITVFRGKRTAVVSLDELKRQAGISADENGEERDFQEFFTNLTEIQDWFESGEKETALKFLTLEKILEDNLKELKVFKIGRTEIDIYVVGLDAQSILTGIKTRAVET